MRETRTIEFKETITNTFLKTVSAFSNYDGGEIFFGIEDNGNIKGLSNIKQACLDIENKINDSITPQPDYTLELQNNDSTGITRIKQLYKEGLKQPVFELSENTIKIVLPVFEKNLNLSEDERKIYKILSKTMLKSISEIAPYAPFGKSKTTQLLKEMGKKGVVRIEGRGRGTKYVIK